tara:strand:+ start:501 stop:1901 length:1401 start_codon:yes stop_codon:yes gene_type:complete
MEFKIKKICCIGAGYVGGPTMAVIADKCRGIEVNVVDLNRERIAAWNSENLSELPIFEPGLKNIIARRRGENLHFSCDVEVNIALADMIFISVNTPIKKSGIGAGMASDLKWVESSTRQILEHAQGNTIVVEKSTLPVKTAKTIKSILESNKNSNKNFSVLSNPEFLAEGTAIDDLINPDRVLIGGEDRNAIDALIKIYKNWVPKNKIITTNLWSSELSKLSANAFLAQRISSINTISAICETTGSNINDVSKAIGMDSRIGSEFLKAGPGFGGSCFKKDILNLVYLCQYYGLGEVANFWKSVVDINSWQKDRISKIIVKNLFGTIAGKKLGIFGFSFKANTNDTRESPAIEICKSLLDEGAILQIYDPKVSFDSIKKDLSINGENSIPHNKNYGHWIFSKKSIEAAKDTDAIIILTDWDEFKNYEWEKIYELMRIPAWIFDTRNIIESPKHIRSLGFNLWQLGIN